MIVRSDRPSAIGGMRIFGTLPETSRLAAGCRDSHPCPACREGWHGSLRPCRRPGPTIPPVWQLQTYDPLLYRLILERVGIADAFDTIAASEDTPRHKPDPDPFLEAARRLGARPERCVVWEDSGLGIEAARRAGMHWIDVRSFHTPARIQPPAA